MSGRDLRERAQGVKHDVLQRELAGVDPGLAEWADDFIFGQVWSRNGLSFEDRVLVAIVALAATNKPNQLRNYLHGALQDGIEPIRIHEAITMLVVYVGFPTVLEAMATWQSVVRSARKKGMTIDVPIQ